MSDCCGEAMDDLRPLPMSLAIMQGDTLAVEFLLRNPPVSPATVGTVADLSGCTVDGAITNRSTRAVTPITVAITDQTGASGKHGTATVLCAVAASFEFDLHIRDASGAERTFAFGALTVQRRR